MERRFLAYDVGRELEALGGFDDGDVINGGSALVGCEVGGDWDGSSWEAESWDFRGETTAAMARPVMRADSGVMARVRSVWVRKSGRRCDSSPRSELGSLGVFGTDRGQTVL